MDSAEQPNSTSLLPAAALLPAAHDQTSDAPSAVSAVIGDIAKIAWPVILSNMVGWSSSFFGLWLLADAGDSASLAAYGLATALCNVTGHAFLWGIGGGLDTLSSQAWGANDRRAVGIYGQRAFWVLTFVVNVPICLVWLNAEALLLALGQDADIARKVQHQLSSPPVRQLYVVSGGQVCQNQNPWHLFAGAGLCAFQDPDSNGQDESDTCDRCVWDWSIAGYHMAVCGQKQPACRLVGFSSRGVCSCDECDRLDECAVAVGVLCVRCGVA